MIVCHDNREETEMEKLDFEKINQMIMQPDEDAVNEARARWDALAKPPHSLGRLEELIVQIAGAERTADIRIKNRAHVIFCADNGVLEEGVSSNTSAVTTFMVKKFLSGGAASAVMCRQTGCDLYVVDVGMAEDIDPEGEMAKAPKKDAAGRVICFEKARVADGTKNLAEEPAMTKEEALLAVGTGRRKAKELKDRGYEIVSAGEMGIGNTTTATAVISVLCRVSPSDITGIGAGVGSGGIGHKAEVIRTALERYGLQREDPLSVLACVGGFDIAALCGFYIGAAEAGMPVIMDGVIAQAAALAAVLLVPRVSAYLIPSHVSKEPAALRALLSLKKEPVLDAGFCLGEGTGALTLYPLLDLGAAVYRGMDLLNG